MDLSDDDQSRWTCPSDRELTLRAKLRSGWSSRAQTADVLSNGISEAEQNAIAQVLERANRTQELEEVRIRKLTERLDRIKKQACGDGRKSCILCNELPKMFGKFYSCKDCHSVVCGKCSIDTYELNTGEAIWLCKICSESREVVKKTNLWTQLASRPSGQAQGDDRP